MGPLLLDLKPEGDTGFDPKAERQHCYGRLKAGDWRLLTEDEDFQYILLNHELVNNTRTWFDPACRKTSTGVRDCHFELSNTLVHEIAHAMDQIAFGGIPTYFRDEVVSETGFAIENHISGGLITRFFEPTLGREILVLGSWPSRRIYCEYENPAGTGNLMVVVAHGCVPPAPEYAILRPSCVGVFFAPAFWTVGAGKLKMRLGRCCGPWIPGKDFGET